MTHNWLFSTRMLFSPDDGGTSGGSGTAPDVSSVPPSGGDSGAPPSQSPAGSDVSPPPASPATDSEPDPTALWANLGSTDDLDFVEPTAPVQPVVQPQPQTPASATPPQPAAQGQQPSAPTPTAPPQPQPQPSADAPAPSPGDPVSIASAIEQNRDAIIAHLATSKFALTQDEVTELETDVVAAVPKLMAKMFVESQTSMQKFLAQSVPEMLKRYNTVTKANDDAESKFFQTHSTLDKNNPQHRATAVRLATLYRQANPQVPLEQLIAEVGPMVMAAVRVNAPPAQPSAPRLPNVPMGFRPAVNGNGGSSPIAAPPDEWSGLGQNFDEG